LIEIEIELIYIGILKFSYLNLNNWDMVQEIMGVMLLDSLQQYKVTAIGITLK
jgi:hypothetical protein